MGMLKCLVVLALAIFISSVYAQPRGSDTHSNIENEVTSPDNASLDTPSVTRSDPVEVDAASTSSSPAVENESAGAGIIVMDDSIAFNLANEDVATENGNNDEKLVELSDTPVGNVDTAVDPEIVIIDDPLVLTDPNVDNAGSPDVETPHAAVSDSGRASVDIIADPQNDADTALGDEESADLSETFDTIAHVGEPTAEVESVNNGDDHVDLGDDALATAAEASPLPTETPLSTTEDFNMPADVAALDVSENAHETLTEAANADYAAAMKELTRINGLDNFSFVEEEEVPVISSEPTAEEPAVTSENFFAANTSVTGSVPESIGNVDLPELIAEASFLSATETPVLTGMNVEFPDGDMISFDSTNAVEIADVVGNTNEPTQPISSELAALASAADAFVVTDAEMEPVVSAADRPTNETSPAINLGPVPSGFQSFIDETREAPLETLASISQNVSAAFEEATESHPLAASGGVAGVEDYDEHEDDDSDERNGPLLSRTSATIQIHNCSLMFACLLVALTTAVSLF